MYCGTAHARVRNCTDRVTMQVFVREHCTMIAAPVQCDVDGIPKGSHYARVPPMGETGKVSPLQG
jgi:hypothetical protein